MDIALLQELKKAARKKDKLAILALADFYEENGKKIEAALTRERAGLSVCRFIVLHKGKELHGWMLRKIYAQDKIKELCQKPRYKGDYWRKGYDPKDLEIIFKEYVLNQSIEIPYNVRRLKNDGPGT